MSNPILCHITPKCGLKIGVEFEGEKDPTDYGGMRPYTIGNLSEIEGLTQAASSNRIDITNDKYTKGVMSPLSKLSLPPSKRTKAGIPDGAKYYAFAHPPPNLLDVFGDYEDVMRKLAIMESNFLESSGSETSEQNLSFCGRLFDQLRSSKRLESEELPKDMTRETTAIFAKFGAYCYFSDEKEVMSVNVISFNKTEYSLRLAGPFDASKQASTEMIGAERVKENRLPHHNECGIIGMGWIRVRETFGGQPASPSIPCDHGAFIFYKDNGETIIYAVRQNQNDLREYLHCGSDFIADANERVIQTKKMSFFSKHIPIDDFRDCRKRVTAASKSESKKKVFDTSKSMRIYNTEANFPILHQALKCRCEISEIKRIVEKEYKGGKIPCKPDEYGWQAIHYGARFYADNDKVIKYLLENSDDDVLMQIDGLGRYPLHIACDSKPNVKVIEMMMMKEKGADRALYKKTKYLESLPIHIACNARASKEVIQKLLDADVEGRTIRAKTAVGRLPLHIALFNNMSCEIIEMLLDAENDRQTDLMSEGIYQWDHGMLPIHIACLNGLDSKIIKLLADRDAKLLADRHLTLWEDREAKSTLFAKLKIGKKSAALASSGPQASLIQNSDQYNMRKDELDEDTEFLSGMRPLHLCLLTKSNESCRVLLLAEKQHSQKKGSNRRVIQQQAVMVDEMNERTCLHLACMNNLEPDIIDLLLVLDPNRIATRMKDRLGCTPLHLACNQRKVNKEIIKALLKTEDPNNKAEDPASEKNDRIEANLNTTKFPSESLDDLGRNPLSLAVKSSVSPDVLEVLLQPEHFDMNGFDDRAIEGLATRIKNNSNLQNLLNMTLASRMPFFIFYIQFVMYACAVTVALYGTDRRFLNEGDRQEWIIVVLGAISVLSIIREFVQMRSEKLNYIFDLQNVFELTNLVLLIMSINIFNQDTIENDPTTQFVLLGSSCLLIINFIFFLRSAFLPFSRFTGGLIKISYTLVPFFAVSMLLLLMFTFIYRILNNRLGEDNIVNATATVNANSLSTAGLMFVKRLKGQNDEGSLASQCEDYFDTCFRAVLSAFFGGGTDGINDVADFFFGLIVVLALLNVVIAVVSDAWEDAKDQATDLFWRGRLTFLMESRSLINLIPRNNLSLLSKVDSMPMISFKTSTISWTRDEPYCFVKSKKEYDDPDTYFTSEIAEQIKADKSPSTDLRWLKIRENFNDEKDEKMNDRVAYAAFFLKWFGCFYMNLFFFLLGFPTAGLLWTNDQRVWIFSLGNVEEDMEEEEDDGKLLKSQIKILQETLDKERELLKEEAQKSKDLQKKLDVWESSVRTLNDSDAFEVNEGISN